MQNAQTSRSGTCRQGGVQAKEMFDAWVLYLQGQRQRSLPFPVQLDRVGKTFLEGQDYEDDQATENCSAKDAFHKTKATETTFENFDGKCVLGFEIAANETS
jgi:hypothetical protein